MSKALIIVESPTKAKTIARFLGKDYVVKSSMGHIRDLPKSKIGVYPAKDFQITYEIPAKAKKTVTELKKLAKSSEEVILATDEDREIASPSRSSSEKGRLFLGIWLIF